APAFDCAAHSSLEFPCLRPPVAEGTAAALMPALKTPAMEPHELAEPSLQDSIELPLDLAASLRPKRVTHCDRVASHRSSERGRDPDRSNTSVGPRGLPLEVLACRNRRDP